MGGFMDKVRAFVEGTLVPAQIDAVDYMALLSNPYFMVPFVLIIGYMIYSQSLKELVLVGLGIGLWIVSGTEYMGGLTVDGELQMNKVLPVAFGAAVLLGIVIYMYFGRSD